MQVIPVVGMEHAAPTNPTSHWQRAVTHTPCPEQPSGQAEYAVVLSCPEALQALVPATEVAATWTKYVVLAASPEIVAVVTNSGSKGAGVKGPLDEVA
jgi:hypothetical protein